MLGATKGRMIRCTVPGLTPKSSGDLAHTGPSRSRQRLHDQRLLELVSRVKCSPSDEADRNEHEFNLCELEIVLKSGERQTVRVAYHRGHFKNPMTDAEMQEKFRSMAQKHLSVDRLDNLLRLLWALETQPQVGTLIAATRT